MTPVDRPIEHLTAALVDAHGLATVPPIDVELLARRMGVGSITRQRMIEDGRLEHRPPSMTRIIVNETVRRSRARFTIAHELGHLLLATPNAPLTARRTRSHFNDEERFCDAFAAALLLPAEWIRSAARGQQPSLELVRSLANVCQTSLAAVVLRCNELLSWSHALLQWRLAQGGWRLVSIAGGSLHGKVRSAPETAAVLPQLLCNDRPVSARLPLTVGGHLQVVAAEVAGTGRNAVALIDVRQLSISARRRPPPPAPPS